MLVIYNLNGTVDLMATREARLGNPTEEELDADDNWTRYWHGLQEKAKKNFEPIVELVETPEAREEFWLDPCWTKSF